MLEADVSQRHVARHHGVSHSVVVRVWNRFQLQGDVKRRHA